MFTRALDIRCSILGDSHLDTAASFCSLGERFKPSSLGLLLSILVAPLASRGNLPQASQTREMLKCSTVDDRSLWLRAGHMALGCGRLYDALDHYGKAADVRFAQLGKNHLDTASSYVNIGNVCVRQGKYAEALGLYRKVRPMRILWFRYARTRLAIPPSSCKTHARKLFVKARAIVVKLHGEDFQFCEVIDTHVAEASLQARRDPVQCLHAVAVAVAFGDNTLRFSARSVQTRTRPSGYTLV